MKNNSIVVYNQNCHRPIDKTISVEEKLRKQLRK